MTRVSTVFSNQWIAVTVSVIPVGLGSVATVNAQDMVRSFKGYVSAIKHGEAHCVIIQVVQALVRIAVATENVIVRCMSVHVTADGLGMDVRFLIVLEIRTA